MNKNIYYIDPKEDPIEQELKTAINRSMEDNFIAYCEHIIANYAMMGIDVRTYPVKRTIQYLDE